jgi:CheY-like chemotaxis protein
MDGVEFLKKVKKGYPLTVRVMLTGNADQQTAIDAVNKGSIFRFLNKPCSAEILSATLIAAIRQYRLVTAEKDILEKTLKGSIGVLIDILSLIEPVAFRRSDRLKYYVQQVAAELDIDNIWEIEAAAMLLPIGYVTLPAALRRRAESGGILSGSDAEVFDDVPHIGQRLLENIARFENVAQMVGMCKNSIFKTAAAVKNESRSDLHNEQELPVGVKLINILTDLIELEESGKSVNDALDIMLRRVDEYDPHIMDKVADTLKLKGTVLRKVTVISIRVMDLLTGDLLMDDIHTMDGRLLLGSGVRLNGAIIERIKNYHRMSSKVKEPIRIERG